MIGAVPSSVPAGELFASLLDARRADDARNAELTFLAGLPLRLGVLGSLFAYGVASRKPWAKWGAGAALAVVGVEYFAARRRVELAAAAAAPAPVPQGGSA